MLRTGKTNQLRDGLYLMLLGAVAFLLFGLVLMSTNRVPLLDFRTAYYSGRCLLQQCDPYRENDIEALYSSRVERSTVSDRDRQVITRNIYLPPAFAVTVPLALLPFDIGLALWFVLIAGGFILASFLMWQVAANQAPTLSAALLCFCFINSASIIYFGNPAGFVIPFCVIAAWCFVRQKFAIFGIVCLAIALAFKPHDACFVWLYFLLAGGLYRKRALQTLALVTAFGIPAVLWTTYISSSWIQELKSNLRVFSVKGGINDPSAGHGVGALSNLQTVTSFFWQGQHAYDLAAYLICAPLLIAWMVAVWRSRRSAETAWLALASVSALTMLPIYHRQYDAKLIILAIPAMAILWARRGGVAWLGLLVTSAAFVLNGDIPWAIFLSLAERLHLSTNAPHGRLLLAAWIFPVPLSLMAMGAFYLWVLTQSSRRSETPNQPAPCEDAPAATA